MNIEDSVKKIVENWQTLKKDTIEGYKAVWIVDNKSEIYKVD